MEDDFSLEEMYHSFAKEPGVDDLSKDIANFLGAVTAIKNSKTDLIYMAQDNFSFKSPFLYDSLEVIEENGEITHVSVYILALFLNIKLPRDPKLHFEAGKRMQFFGNNLISKGYEVTIDKFVTTGFYAVDNDFKEEVKKRRIERGEDPNSDIMKLLDSSPQFTGKDFLNHFFKDMFH